MFDPKKFTTPSAKPLPVVLLLDVSSSMHGDKIDNLNKAVQNMLAAFANEEKMETEILVSVITFGGQVNLHLPFTKASQIQWKNLDVNGDTPMGTALKMAKAMIEDKETTPSRAYRPTIVLVSDGQPTDGNIWKQAMEDFINSGRSSKCDRMAVSIGSNADQTVLKKFIQNMPHELLYVENAGQLHEHFQKITMSVTMRLQSKNPNDVPDPTEIKLDGDSAKEALPVSASDSSDEGYW